MKSYKSHVKALGEIEDTFRQALERHAECIRQQIIIPFCKKRRLGFLSGNGTFFFYSGEDNYIIFEHAPKTLQPEMKRIYRILDIEVAHNHQIGMYVRNVSKEDYK